MSRTADMLAIIARQDGSEVARERCTVLMRVISGEMTMEAAAEELGISRQRLHEPARSDGGDVGGEPGAAGARPPGRARARREGSAHRRAWRRSWVGRGASSPARWSARRSPWLSAIVSELKKPF